MKSNLYDRNEDLKEYARKRLLEMDSLEDRQLLKGLLHQVIEPCISYLEDAYLSLEERVFDEMVLLKHVPIFIGVAKPEEYDATDDQMFPIIEADVVQQQYSIEDIKSNIDNEGSFSYQKILVQEDYIHCQQLIESNKIYEGVFSVNGEDVSMSYKLKRATAYEKELQSLFDVFSLNYLEWLPVCAPYFKKVFTVEIVSVDTGVKGEITGHRYDLTAHTANIIENPILLWNITKAFVKTSSYPEPCVDGLHYDHRIVASKLDEKSRYLVCNTDVYISNIRRINNDLVISTDVEDPTDFELLRITNKGSYYFDAKVFGNEKEENFISTYKQSTIKTKAELSRLIASYNYSDFVSFEDCETVQQSKESSETYNVDIFEQDEIRMEKYKPSLNIMFSTEHFTYFTRDIMSFLISVVQKYFPEYQCRGILIKNEGVI